jgi:hypothetical protein
MPDPKTLRSGEWAILEAHWPGQPPQRIGLLLHDQTGNKLRAKVRRDWSTAEGESEAWADLAADIERMASEVGAQQTVEWLEDTASHTIRLGARKAVTFSDIEAALETLYIHHVIEGSATESKQAKGAGISRTRTWPRALGLSGSVGALAANIALFAVRSLSHHPSQSPAMTAQMAQKGCPYDSPLPPLLSDAFPNRLADVTLRGNLSASGQRATAIPSPRRRKFHPNTRSVATVRPHITRATLPPSPSLPIVTQTAPSGVAPSLPTPPDFRPRRRFLRAVITPFRTIALAFSGHGNDSASESQ